MTQKHPLLTTDDHSVRSTMSDQGVHSDRVLDWREVEFVRLGFLGHDASALAATRIDTHQMEKLISSGCSHELAWRILMGTMWSGPDPLWVDSYEGGYMDTPLMIEDEDEDDKQLSIFDHVYDDGA